LTQVSAWLALGTEGILEPALPIIDAHHHMWDRPPERYGLDEVLADVRDGHNVRATVFMECTAMWKAEGPDHLRPVGETEYVNGAAAQSASGIYGESRVCAGIVSHADLRRGAAAREVLEAHVRAGGGRFCGIRQQAQFDEKLGSMSRRAAPKDLLMDADFRAGFAELAPLGLTFDAYIYFTQLGQLADLAGAYPDTGVILNHVGAPLGIGPYAGRREEVFAAWSRSIVKLARRPNVTVKIGGMGMPAYGFGFHEQATPPSSEDLAAVWRPYVETCIDAFGADRCMFESNFPVDKKSYSYSVLWNALKRLSIDYSADERRALFSGTAARIYRIRI